MEIKIRQLFRRLPCAAIACCLFGMAGPPALAQTPYNLTVRSGGLRQSFAGFGVSQDGSDGFKWDDIPVASRGPMTDQVFADLKVEVLKIWVHTDSTRSTADMLDEVKTKYIDTACISEVKARGVDTLLLVPAHKDGADAPPSDIPDYAAKIAELILQLKNTYNIQINATGIQNEPGTWSSVQIVSCINELRAALNTRGLTAVKVIAPETSGNNDTFTTHLDTMYNDVNAWNNTDAIASHSYHYLVNEDQEVRKRDKQWWITEAGEGTGPEQTENENIASSTLARMLCELNHGVDTWLYFFGIGTYKNLASQPPPNSSAFLVVHDRPTGNIVTYLKYYYLKQLLNTIDKGAVFRSCVSATEGAMFTAAAYRPAISAAAAVNPDGSWGIAVVNETGVPEQYPGGQTESFYPAAAYNVTVTVQELAGSGNKTFNVYRSRANQHFVNSGTVTLVNGVGTVSIAAKELVCLRSGAVAPAIPPVPTGLTASTINTPVTLYWNNTVGATSWKVKRSTTSGGPYTVLGTTNTTTYVDNTAVNGTVYFYVVSAVNTVGESANSGQVSVSPTPFPWQNVDIGGTGLAGSFTCSDSGVFTIRGAGSNIWGTADAFNFTYTSMQGDSSIICRLAQVKNAGAANAKFGIAMRNSLSADSTMATLYYDLTSHAVMLCTRSSTGGNNGYATGTSMSPPQWLKLTRAGSIFTGYTSADGVTWTTVGSASITMASSFKAGMAVCSRNPAVLATAIYDNVTVPPAAPTELNSSASTGQVTLKWTASYGATTYTVKRGTNGSGPFTTLGSTSNLNYTDLTVTAGTNYYYVVSAGNSAGTSADSTAYRAWLNQDVGAAGTAGNVSVTKDGVFTARGAGTNFSGSADAFNFSYITMTGDGSFVTRLIDAPTSSGNTAKVGVAVRGSLAADAQSVVAFYDYTASYLRTRMAYRSAAGGTTSYVEGTVTTVPVWLKITRAGNVFSSYSSANGTTWTTIGSATIAMPSTTHIGLAVCSRNTGYALPATYDGVTVP